jgi:hypothetical protein
LIKCIRNLLLLGCLASVILMGTLSSLLAATSDGSLSDTNIKYIGRWDFSNSSQYCSYWCGAYIKVNFTGTTIKINLGNTNNYYAKIDNQDWATYINASGTLNLTPIPLANGTHTLTVTSGKDYGYEFKYQGFILDAGATTVAPAVQPNIIEFIGDSITCGYTDPREAVSSYGWYCADCLNCEHTQISYPGILLVSGYGPNSAGMDAQYFKLQPLGYTNPPDWDFIKYTPKIVVINLGTNDNGTGVPDNVLQSTYTTFMANIRAKFPNAEIFALRCFGGYKAAPTQAAVNARVSAGDTKVYYVDTNGWLTESSDYTDGLHPSENGNIKAANQLAPILAPYLGVVNITPIPTYSPTPTPTAIPGALNRTGWVGSGTGSGFSNAFDGNASTRWSTDAVQVNGQYFQVDMQTAKTFNQIQLDTSGSPNDYPRGYQVFVSSDATNWGSAIATGAATNAITNITFSSQTKRYLKIVQTGSAGGNFWSIHEFNVYNLGATPTPTPTSTPTPTPALGALNRTGWTALASLNTGAAGNSLDGNASTRWDTAALQANGQWFTVDMKTSTTFNKISLDTTGSPNDYPRGYQVTVSNDGTNFGSVIASGAGNSAITDISFAAQTARFVKVTQTGSAAGNYWSIHEFNVYNTSGTPTPTSTPTPTPVPGGATLDTCDSLTGWSSHNTLSLDTTNKQQGTGCLSETGAIEGQFWKSFSTAVNTGVTESAGYLEFEYYISDATKLGTNSQIEISSSGAADVNEYSWSMPTGLVNGWNHFKLKLSNAGKSGTPNLSAINWFRIYNFVTASVTAKIDNIRFTP